MALTPGSIFESDTTGATETITLSPAPPNTSTLARIASAFYGTDATSTPIPATVAADGKSVSIKVLLGINFWSLRSCRPVLRQRQSCWARVATHSQHLLS